MHGPAALGLWPVHLLGHIRFTALLRRAESLSLDVVLHPLTDMPAIPQT